MKTVDLEGKIICVADDLYYKIRNDVLNELLDKVNKYTHSTSLEDCDLTVLEFNSFTEVIDELKGNK